VLHPHQTRYVVPASEVHPLPDGVPASRAILAANLETAINGLWDGGPSIGDRVAVVGAGTVGCLLAWMAGQIPGATVELIDPNPRRAAVAEALGVGFRHPDEATPEADQVYHVSGSPDGLPLALQLGAFETTVVDLSWYGDRSVRLPLGEAFHARRLTLKSSQVGVVAGGQRARWTTRRRLALALQLLTDSTLDCLISGESAFEDLPALMARLASSPADEICHRIRYDEFPDGARDV